MVYHQAIVYRNLGLCTFSLDFSMILLGRKIQRIVAKILFPRTRLFVVYLLCDSCDVRVIRWRVKANKHNRSNRIYKNRSLFLASSHDFTQEIPSILIALVRERIRQPPRPLSNINASNCVRCWKSSAAPFFSSNAVSVPFKRKINFNADPEITPPPFPPTRCLSERDKHSPLVFPFPLIVLGRSTHFRDS